MLSELRNLIKVVHPDSAIFYILVDTINKCEIMEQEIPKSPRSL